MNLIQQELMKIERYFNSGIKEEISLEIVKQQLYFFINGVKIPKLIRPCVVGDGILKLSQNNYDVLIREFTSAEMNGRITKFVPASGAATRMFHRLHSVTNRFNKISLEELHNKSENDAECKSAYNFLTNLKKFAFYNDLKKVLNIDDIKLEKMIRKSPAKILEAVLFKDGLNYSSMPKGAIKFHCYENDCRTAFEEQVYESFQYISDKKNDVKIHFTISEEHTYLFKEIIKQFKSKISNTDFKIDVRYSYQKKHTDTIAVNNKNEIMFDKDGVLIQRPGGHGALLENLDELNGDILVIKNIDNLSVERLSPETILYKKLLIGLLSKTQKVIFNFLQSIEENELSDSDYQDIVTFAEQNLSISKPENFDNWGSDKKKKFLFDKLNRPIRVCGMVKNEGEPGGGPFWVQDDDESLSLQIIEQAQIDMQDENQKLIFKQSTHFNPVDLICGIKDYKGNNFTLKNFADPKSAIITKKSKHGVELKALELPGLWNGSMAYWNTIFVEVPKSTFNPVKEINDLLKEEHQN